MEKNKLTLEEREKIIDFRNFFIEHVKVLDRKKDDKEVQQFVECIFWNLAKYYLEYKETVHFVSVEDEPYQFHLLQPVNGKYSLLDFLLNRVFSNIEKLEYESIFDAWDYATKTYHRISKSPYDVLKQGSINMQHNIVYLHETNHALYACDKNFSGKVSIGSRHNEDFFTFIKAAHEKYGHKYNILSLEKLKEGLPETRDDYYEMNCSLPFGGAQYYEGLAEICAVMSYGLLDDTSCIRKIDLGDDRPIERYVGTTNFTKYTLFYRFLFYLKNSVSKKSFFSSSFFGSYSAIEEFGRKNHQIIDMIYDQFNVHIQFGLDILKKNKRFAEKNFTNLPVGETAKKIHYLLLLSSYDSYVIHETPDQLEARFYAHIALENIFLLSFNQMIEHGDYEDKDELEKTLLIASKLSLSADIENAFPNALHPGHTYYDSYMKLIDELRVSHYIKNNDGVISLNEIGAILDRKRK